MGDAGSGEDFVGEIDGERTIFENEGEEVEDVAGVELAGMDGDLCGKVEGGEEGDAVDGLLDAGQGELAVAAGRSGEVNEDGAGTHGRNGVAADEARGGTAGYLGGGDDDVRMRGGAGDEIAAAVESFLAELGSVASAAFRVDAAEIDIEEFGAQGTNLLSGGGADVIGSTTAPGGARWRWPASRRLRRQ